MRTAVGTGLLAAAVLWPSHIIGPLDGAPLDAPLEAIVIGLLIPSVWWLCRRSVTLRLTRWAIVALLLWKAADTTLATQQGLCVSMNAGQPLDGINQGIPIIEPTGALRSWDVRADWRAVSPRCTAIATRPFASRGDFPAWFLNVTSQLRVPQAVRFHATGYVTTSRQGTLAFTTATDDVAVQVDGRPVGITAELMPGVHAIDVTMTLTGENWRFEPTIDGQPLSSGALVTVAPPATFDRLTASWAWLVTPLLIVLVLGGMAQAAWRQIQPPVPVVISVVGLVVAAAALGLLPQQGLQRLIGVVLLAGIFIPVSSRLRNMRGAFLAIGVPWLAFVASLSVGQAGRFTLYSYDDWLTYQVAGHRIYFQGYWLEGGNEVFDFQPFYRWMTGALHLVFGDSSVGELYWDAACVLFGALLAFHLARTHTGFRAAAAAAAATIATMTLGTPWYFLGRGLSEIAAAGWAFLAMFCLLRGRRGTIAWSIWAGGLAVLMFYTRLNHLLFAAVLPAFLLPCRTPAVVSRVRAALTRLRWRAALAYVATFAIGVLLFALRTWHYTGVFSLFYGTSLKNNDTGLRPWTLLSGDVWSRISHSLQATIFMNEPPHPDPRAVFVILGVLIAAGAAMQLPILRRVPAVAVLTMAGAIAGAFLAHAHGYPGRFTIHIIPFACVLTMTAAFGRVRGVA